MEPFKNIFNEQSVNAFSDHIMRAAGKIFDKCSFTNKINTTLTTLELKDRVRLISNTLHEHLTNSYAKNIDILLNTLADEESDNGITGFMAWPLLQYVEDYGRSDDETSFKAMYEMTKRFSAEFAIRPFLKMDDVSVFNILEKWLSDPNKHVRRLCSEGTRPNLPWGLKVHSLNDNLHRNLAMLNKLKDDPEEYVRRSVANHLNDISRINPNLMLETVTKWSKGNSSKEMRWLIRHATRTLLKQGHKDVLQLHGYNPNADIHIKGTTLNKKKVKEGGEMVLCFQLINKTKCKQKILIDYVIHFLKKNGKHSPKVFRLKDTTIDASGKLTVEKRIPFKKVTTRKHYKGKHKISLQVNGRINTTLDFELV